MKIGDKVIDTSGYTGVIVEFCNDTGQVLVRQKRNVWCTYDSVKQLRKVSD